VADIAGVPVLVAPEFSGDGSQQRGAFDEVCGGIDSFPLPPTKQLRPGAA
jgi:hypothetical protein